MKTLIAKWTTAVTVSGSLFCSIGNVRAQDFTSLSSFTGSGDGAYPLGGLTLSGNTLYGTTPVDGSGGGGTVFAVNTDGTSFATLHSFTGGSDGANSVAGVTLSGNTLYGTTEVGGSGSSGTVFAVNTNGTGFATLYSFTGGGDGDGPLAGVTLSGNTLYGTTFGGGSDGYGTVFAVNTDGTGFATLYNFTGGSDGATPLGEVTLSGNTLYGTTVTGGSGGGGTVFAVNIDGTGFTTLYSFTGGNDGANPFAGVTLSGNTLYGTTYRGSGTVFAVDTDGTGFTTLYSFTGGSDGANPLGGLTLSGNTLYGTAWTNNHNFVGTVFAVHTDGTGFTTLYSFTGGSDGGAPNGGVILSGDTLYGTTQVGGSGYGTVFSLSLTPQDATGTLINTVNDLVALGVLSPGNGNSLTSKLDNALAKINAGQTKTAQNLLQAFINSVNALVQSGRLSADSGTELINAADQIIALLGP